MNMFRYSMQLVAGILLAFALLFSGCSVDDIGAKEIVVSLQPAQADAVSPAVSPAGLGAEAVLPLAGEPEESALSNLSNLSSESAPASPSSENLSETARDMHFGTLIDLSTLTDLNCVAFINELKGNLSDVAYEQKLTKEDIRDQAKDVAEAQQELSDAEQNGDTRDLEIAGNNLESERDRAQDLQYELSREKRKAIALKETLERAEPICASLRKDRYK